VPGRLLTGGRGRGAGIEDEIVPDRSARSAGAVFSAAALAPKGGCAAERWLTMILRMMRDLLRPTVWVTVERVFTEVFSLTLFAVQARLLGPTAFGLIAAVMVFISFWDAVPMNAVLEALVSVRRIEERHFTTGATATVLVSLMFGAAVFGCAGPMAELFGDAEMGSVMRAMAVLPLLQAFSIVPLAMTRREVRFQATTVRTIVSLVAGGAVGLVLALAGMGVWALVWQALVQRLVAAIVLWSIVQVPVRPALSFRHGRDLLGFIVPVLWSSVMSWGAGQLPRLFLGIFLGPADLGLFATADRFNAVVKHVAIVPKAFVARIDLRRYTTDRAAMTQAVRRMFLQMALVGFPICFGGAAVMPTLIRAWLDSRWYGAILPGQIMLLACIPYVTFYGASAILYAVNRQARDAVVATVLNPSIVAGMAVAMQFGLVATSAAVAVIPWLLLPLPVLAVRGTGHVKARDILLPQMPALLAAVTMGGAVALLRPRLAPYVPDVTALPVLILAGVALYAILIVILMPRRAISIAGQLGGRLMTVWGGRS
jgi:O-antigen/teichoic acid export membrane protein